MHRRRTSAVLAAVSAAAIATTTPAQAKPGGFTSPSGNIGCYITAGWVRCDIEEHSWPTPSRPASCELDYGQGVTVARRGRGHFVCAGDTALRSGPPLAYGKRRRAGRFTCVSRTSGMRCFNRRNGHGFSLSRDVYRLF